MSYPKSLISRLKKKLPEMATVADMVRLGVYRSAQGAYAARKSGRCPPFIRVPCRGIIYPRQGVLDFFQGLENEKGAKPQKGDSIPSGNGKISHASISPLRQNSKNDSEVA
jgi:hypothetical protein